MNPEWLQKPTRGDSIKDQALISSALDWITFDIDRPVNAAVWSSLHSIEPMRLRIQLFDSVWWMYFKAIQPVLRQEDVGKI